MSDYKMSYSIGDGLITSCSSGGGEWLSYDAYRLKSDKEIMMEEINMLKNELYILRNEFQEYKNRFVVELQD